MAANPDNSTKKKNTLNFAALLRQVGGGPGAGAAPAPAPAPAISVGKLLMGKLTKLRCYDAEQVQHLARKLCSRNILCDMSQRYFASVVKYMRGKELLSAEHLEYEILNSMALRRGRQIVPKYQNVLRGIDFYSKDGLWQNGSILRHDKTEAAAARKVWELKTEQKHLLALQEYERKYRRDLDSAYSRDADLAVQFK
jgi:hypothetical protein